MRALEEAGEEERQAQLKAEKEAAEAKKRESVTFGEMAELFLEWSENNKKSHYADRNRYEKYLEGRFKDTPIKEISPFDLERLKAS